MIGSKVEPITKRLPGETELQYITRLGDKKYEGLIDMTWPELAECINKELNDNPDEYVTDSVFRKKYALVRKFREDFGDATQSADAEELKELRRELEKERVKVRDERNEYRRLLREQARKESYMEQFIRSITEAADSHALEYEDNARFHGTITSDKDMIIPLSDVHAGIDINNFWNEYNEDVLKKRLNHYLDRIFEIQLTNGCQNAYVLLSELISGSIHSTLRIENNQDLVDQFLMVCDYIADFIAALSYRFNEVNVYVAPGNHSRITPNIKESLDHENFDNLVIPFLGAKLQNFKNVTFHTNDIEQGIAMFAVRGMNVAFVHGDKDTPDNVIDNLIQLTGIKWDLILLGHRHTNAYMTRSNVKVVQTGCLSGTDSFAISKRLNNYPEQTVLVIDEEEGLDCIYDVKFKN